ncbi:uncharacterized protein si:ch73-347e22.4 [Hoplias malabaricus]|uniref:uncharacterized protein si:ch73-347e22.4 n=1 Tax=Hoplias malabaricus TaxID=27720 RepID=UPI003462AEC0
MNCKFPSWNSQEGNCGMLYESDTPWEQQGFNATDDVSANFGEATTAGNIGERSKDFSDSIWTPTADQKTHLPFGQRVPSGMADDTVNYSYYQLSRQPIRSNMGHSPEDYGERTTAIRKERCSVSDHLTDASTSASHVLINEKDHDLEKGCSSNWTSVIKEALEMSNGMALEQDLSCSTSEVYEGPQSGTKQIESVKDYFDSDDFQHLNIHEKSRMEEMNGARDSSLTVLSYRTNILTQDVQQRVVNFMADDLSVDDKVVQKSMSRTLEQCSSLGFCSASTLSSMVAHNPIEHKEDLGLTISYCLSDKSTLIKTNIDEQFKNRVQHMSTVPSSSSDNSEYREFTLSSATPLFRQMTEVHDKSFKDVSSRRSVDNQSKLCQDFHTIDNNETLPGGVHVLGQTMNLHMTQNPNFEPNVLDDVRKTCEYECTGSDMTVELETTENEKPGVSHKGFRAVEVIPFLENTEGTSKGEAQPPKGQTENSNTVSISIFAEPSSVCSSTSVNKLENLVHNLYKVSPPTSTLKSKEPFQMLTDTTSNTATECEDSKIIHPAEVYSTAYSSEKVDKKHKTNKCEKIDNAISIPQICTTETQETSTYQVSIADSRDLAHDEVLHTKPNVINGEDSVNKPNNNSKKQIQLHFVKNLQNVQQNHQKASKWKKTLRKSKALDSSALTGQQQMTGESRKSNNYSPKTNIEALSLTEDVLMEVVNSKNICPAEHHSAIQNPQKVIKKHKANKCEQRDNSFSIKQMYTTETQDASTFQVSIAEPGHLISDEVQPTKANEIIGKDSVNMANLKTNIQLNSVKNVQNVPKKTQNALKVKNKLGNKKVLDSSALTGQEHKIISEGRETSNYSLNTNTEVLSSTKEVLSAKVTTSDVSHRPRKKQKKLVKGCGSSNKISSMPKMQVSSNAINTMITKQNFCDSELTEKQGDGEEQSCITPQIPAENAASVTEDIIIQRSQPKRGIRKSTLPLDNIDKFKFIGSVPAKLVNQNVYKQKDCLSTESTSDAPTSVKSKMHAETFRHNTSNDITDLEDTSKLLESNLSVNSGLSLKKTSRKFNKKKTTAQKCTVSSHFLLEDVISRSEMRIRRHTNILTGVNATTNPEVQKNLQEPENSEVPVTDAHSIFKKMKKTSKFRRKELKGLKKHDVQRPKTRSIAQSSCLALAQRMDNALDFQPSRISEEDKCRQNANEVNMKAKKIPKELDIIFQPVSDLKTEPREVNHYLKKLRQRKVTCTKHAADDGNMANNVKIEPGIYPQSCCELPVTKCEIVSKLFEKESDSITVDPKLAECKMDDYNKNNKASVFKKRRPSCLSKKRRLTKTQTSTVQGTSENLIAQKDLIKTEVKKEEIGKRSSVENESPEQTQIILSHSVGIDITDSGKYSYNNFPNTESHERHPKKLRRSTRTVAVVEQTSTKNSVLKCVSPVENDDQTFQISHLITSTVNAENDINSPVPRYRKHRKISRTSRKRTLGITSENDPSKQRISYKMENHPQALPRMKKRGKNNKELLQNFSVRTLRCSRRLSRFTRGNVKRHVKADNNVEIESISSNNHSTSSKKLRQKSRKPQQYGEIERAFKPSNINEPLLKSSTDITESCPLAVTNEGKESSLYCRTLRRHKLQLSEEKVTQVETGCIPPTPEPLENSLHAEIEKADGKCGLKSHILKQSSLMAERGENPCGTTESTNKRKKSQRINKQMLKKEALSQQANSLQEVSGKADLFETPRKTNVPKKEPNLRDEMNQAKQFHADSNTLLKSTVEEVPFDLSTSLSTKSKNKDVEGGEFRTNTRWVEEKNEDSKTNGNAALELSLQIADAYCDKNIKEEKSEMLVQDTATTDPKVLVDIDNKDIYIQNCASQMYEFAKCYEDFLATSHKGICELNDERVGSLSKGLAKKCIICKYCGQSFRHISAYTIHQRIHTGEKPYKCKLCGKNFAQLSELKSHRKIHMLPALCCPCCNKSFLQKNSLISHFKTHLSETKQEHIPVRTLQCKPSTPLNSLKHFICKICKNNFPNKIKLKTHMCVHEGERNMSSRTYKFQKLPYPKVHEKTKRTVKPYACSTCGKGFNRLKTLKRHSLGHPSEEPLLCSDSVNNFYDPSALRIRKLSKLCNGKGQSEDNFDIEGFLVSQEVDGQVKTPIFFRCQICKQLFRKWCQYTLHLETHTRCPPYLCFSCGQSYEKDSEVRVHCKVCCQNSGEELACRASLSETLHSKTQNNALSQNTLKTRSTSMSTECHSQEDEQTTAYLQRTDFVTSQPSVSSPLLQTVNHSDDPDQLPIHLQSGIPSPAPSAITHVSSNDSLECVEILPSLWKFVCPRCGQRYNQYTSLHTDMQTHARGFRYACGHCGQSFDRWNQLWLHQRIHRRKRRCYSCSQCNLKFHFFGLYKEHMLVHAGERPFACPVCPETFAHQESLHAHQHRIHHPSKNLQCDVCAKTFSSLKNLLKHSRLHNGAVSLQCLSCKEFFTNRKILQEHLRTHTNSANLPLSDIPLTFPHKCKKCPASFSTGDLLYAHQICHFRGQLCPTYITESVSSLLEERAHPHTESPTPSTTRPVISTLNLDTVPNENLYTYPHPDKLYVMPSLSRTRLQIINLDAEDEENPQQPSHAPNISMSGSEHSGQRIAEGTSACSETDTTCLLQESPESTQLQSQITECLPTSCTSNVQDKFTDDSLTQTDNFVEINFILEENAKEKEELEENFKCADCSYNTISLSELQEHYLLHAFGI